MNGFENEEKIAWQGKATINAPVSFDEVNFLELVLKRSGNEWRFFAQQVGETAALADERFNSGIHLCKTLYWFLNEVKVCKDRFAFAWSKCIPMLSSL